MPPGSRPIAHSAGDSERLWWRDGVIYQVYPRSFADSNGDGVGDLEGIRSRLDHLAWLGVAGIWISPFFPSPMKDFGYDVSDYCDVDPIFGSLSDFDRLLRDAHERGIRVILDFVPNHSSDQHPWFLEARASRTNPRRDWYVWRDPAPGGGPPNNWVAIFGGPAWEWDAATGQYYLHSFLREQPELNWRNPELERAMHAVLRFWLERGVDGFRIDVAHRIAKDPALRSNPLVPGSADPGYGGQLHVHDEDHPDVHALFRRMRALVDEYDERVLIGEVYLFDPARVAKYYGAGDELHQGFNFSLLSGAWSGERFRHEVERFHGAVPPQGWPNQVLSNHDVHRHATRYDHAELGEARARLAALLLLALRGTPFLYYGEEIGMRCVPIPEHRLRDPLAITLHPSLTRDPERTPMQWDETAHAGFSSAEPWLPIHADSTHRNVRAQRADAGSLLHLYRALIALRAAHPALSRGAQRTLPAPAGVFAFERARGGERFVAALNFGDEAAVASLGAGAPLSGLCSRHGAELPRDLAHVTLGPAEGVVLRVA
ncbi:MAG: alpha-amylase family glycosyl hydrolase [Myxococcota bacterium]